MALNKAELIGHLGADPEVRYLPDGTPTVTVSIATTSRWKDKTGAAKEKTEWHRVVFFRKLAEIVAEYIKKGSHIYVEGRLQTRAWEKDGVTHYTTEIVANNLEMLDKKPASADDAPPASEVPPMNQAPLDNQYEDEGAF